MFKYGVWLAAAITLAWFGCGGNDDGGDDDPGESVEPGNGAGDGAGQGSDEPRLPTEEEISAALADAGVFFDEGGVTIGDSRIDLGPDGIRVDDASVVSVRDGSVVIGSGDSAIAIRTDGTCAELLACCESLTEETTKMECSAAHAELSVIPLGGGDFLCAQVVPGYCP
jgi:hypothetical protein